MTNLFSVNRAADLLERDRQTLVRALRRVAPDGSERGQPRYRFKTITVALAAHERRTHGGPGRDPLRSRLGEIADELEELHRLLDAKRAVIKALPTLEEKQPHSRAAMNLLERLRLLHDEAGGIMHKLDPTSLSPLVSGPIIGTEFRELLAAIWGRKMTLDGVPLFPPEADQ
ncbi:hypothetical protein ACVMAJ_000983 [Bradyrhizobium sp. USDA 4448]